MFLPRALRTTSQRSSPIPNVSKTTELTPVNRALLKSPCSGNDELPVKELPESATGDSKPEGTQVGLELQVDANVTFLAPSNKNLREVSRTNDASNRGVDDTPNLFRVSESGEGEPTTLHHVVESTETPQLVDGESELYYFCSYGGKYSSVKTFMQKAHYTEHLILCGIQIGVLC